MVGVSTVESAIRDTGVWRQMVGVSRVESGNEGQWSLETDGWSQQSLTPAADTIELRVLL